MKFKAKVIASGNATAVEVPAKVMKALGPSARPLVVATINGHQWRSRVALMRGMCLVGISAANREKSGIAEGELVTLDLALDEAPRIVDEPADLTKALNRSAKVRSAFDRLPYGLKRKHVVDIESAKAEATRERRIAKLVDLLKVS